MSNDPQTLARYAGIAKGTLAGGLAASFGTEASGISQLKVVAFNFTIQAAGLVCMFVAVLEGMKETNYFEEENVVVPGAGITKDLEIKGVEMDSPVDMESAEVKC
jgi:hypothetical protein